MGLLTDAVCTLTHTQTTRKKKAGKNRTNPGDTEEALPFRLSLAQLVD